MAEDNGAFRAWLVSARLGRHEEQLNDLGYDDLQFLRDLDDDGLRKMETSLEAAGMPPGIVARFVMAARKLSAPAADPPPAPAPTGQNTAMPASFVMSAGATSGTQLEHDAPAVLRFCPRCRNDRGEEEEQCADCGSSTLDLPLAMSRVNEAIAEGFIVNRRFRVTRRLGAGGMGEVWLAQDGHLDLPRVVKTIKASDGNVLKQLILRFRHEAIYGAEVNHPNVAKVFEYQQAPDGLIYLVMEFVEGRNLLQVLEQDGPASAEFVFGVLLQALDGLDALHAAGVIHRDIKLENLMWSPAAGQLKIVDCGIAKRERDSAADDGERQAGATTITRQGVRGPASPAYAPPEYWRELPADRRSDLYSLAVAAFQLLAGELPFKARNTADLMVAIVSDPLPLERLPADADGVLRDAIVRAAAKDPEERFQTAGEFKAFLEAGQQQAARGGELAAAQERADAQRERADALQARLAALEALAKEQQEAEGLAAAGAEQARLAELEALATEQQEAEGQALPVSDVAEIDVESDCDQGREQLRLLAAHRFPGLVKLRLAFMREIGQEIAEVVTAAMREGRLPALQELDLFDSDIGEVGATAVAAALGQVPGLQSLNLVRNRIGDAGATAIAAALGQVPGLRMLNLTKCNVGDKESIKRQVRAALPNVGALCVS